MEDLKPCPFCGEKATLYPSKSDLGRMGARGEQYRRIFPRCGTARCVGNQGWVGFVDKQEAIKAWNTRYNGE